MSSDARARDIAMPDDLAVQKQLTRERILRLVDEMEHADAFATATLARKVRREATRLRSLRRAG